MRLQRPLGVITPTVDGAVLQVLALAEASFTPPQIRAVIGEYSDKGVRRTLQRLVAEGVVTEQPAGRGSLYTLNRDHLAAPAIEELARLRQRFLERLSSRLGAFRTPPTYAALFGSAARSAMHADSDIDLLIVRPAHLEADDAAWRTEVDALVADAAMWTGNDVRVLEYGADEIDTLLGEEAVLGEIAVDGIRLLGPRGYLQREGR